MSTALPRRARTAAAVLLAAVLACLTAVPGAGAKQPAPDASEGFRFKGVIEGFYGPPWPAAERMAFLEWMVAHGMNTYVHAPKNDPYQRLRWRQPYPGDTMARFAREVAFARRSGLAWIPSVSPAHPLIEAAEQERDRDLCFSCEADRAVLFAKLDAFWDIGVRQFMVSFDDTLQVSTHPEDAAAYGVGPFSYGTMNADLLNLVWDRYAARSPDFQLITVPADYFGTTTTPYLEGFRSRLREEVVVMWTGVLVVSPTISCTEAEGYARAVGRKPLLWDNYPVNDYAPDKLLIGPYAGRAPDLPRCLSGILSNPANQVRANRIPLYTVADYLHDPAGYDKERSFAASLDAFADDQRDLLDPFILNVRSSPLDRTEAPRFAALRDAFLAAMGSPDWPRHHDALAAELRAEQAAPAALRTGFADKAFVAELDRATTGNPVQGYGEGGSWLDRLAFNAGNGLEAADAVAATRPQLEVQVQGRTLRGRVGPSASPQEAAAALEELRTMRDRADGNPANVHGDRFYNALGPTYVGENRMDQLFDAARDHVAAYLPTAPVASRQTTVTVAGQAVQVADDGTFTAEVPSGDVEVLAVDGAGGATRRTVQVAARRAPGAAPGGGAGGGPGGGPGGGAGLPATGAGSAGAALLLVAVGAALGSGLRRAGRARPRSR